METVPATSEGPVAYLTIDRPEKTNAPNPQVIREIREALRELEGSGHRALVVSGAGDKTFVAGADIEGMSSMSPVEAKRFYDLPQEAFRLLERLPVPTIASVEGFALGVGSELVLACDLRVASESAVSRVTLAIRPRP